MAEWNVSDLHVGDRIQLSLMPAQWGTVERIGEPWRERPYRIVFDADPAADPDWTISPPPRWCSREELVRVPELEG